jgi:hypothetical protein
MTDEAKQKITKLASQGIDWDYFLSKAKNEGVAALIYRVLSQEESLRTLMPIQVSNELKDAYYCTFGRNAIILRSLEELSAFLAQEKIGIILFKGLMLAELVYKDLGVKPMSDIDILVKKADLMKLDRILKSIGYAPVPGADVLLELPYTRHRNSIDYSKPSAITLHVYWHIINYVTYDTEVIKKIDMDKIWSEAKSIRIGGANIFTFSPRHQIIYLCLHSMIHCFCPLLLGSDLNEYIRSEREFIDWDLVTKEAISFGIYKYVYYGLYFIKHIFDAEIPPEVLKVLKPEKMSYFEKKLILSIIDGKPVRWTEDLLSLGMNENFADRIKFIFNTVFPSREEMAVIRQKRISDVSSADYLRRLCQAVFSPFKILGK